METIFTFSPYAVAAIPVALGLVEVVKRLGISGKYAPVASILIGIGLVSLTGVAWQAFIIQGIIVGLSASGLWSGTKSVIE